MTKRKWLILIATLLLTASLGGYFWLFADFPNVNSLPEHFTTPSVRIVDRYGRSLYDLLPEVGGRHIPVSLEEIPQALLDATVATEDQNFYTNPGIDLGGILRSLWINITGGETLAGGSTITQQVARTLLFSTEERFERTARRKIREAILAWQLTRKFSKEEILALYLNQSYYGGMAYGVEAAAETFFGKPAIDLDLAECALLAGLPQGPALYNPLIDPEAAKNRQSIVLELMHKQGYISQEQHQFAKKEPLVYTSSPYPIEAPHFVFMVQAQLDQLLTQEQQLTSGGLVIVTTLDLDWQHHAETAIRRQLKALSEDKDAIDHNVHDAALVALDPQNGEVLALVGSPDYFDADINGAVNMVISPRQPGSSIKPLVYAAALDPKSSQPWTAATMLLDVSTSFTTHDGKAYVPANYDKSEHGPVSVRTALASSLNIPAVLTLDHIGLDALIQQATALGISTLNNSLDIDLSLALGGGEVRLLELTAAFGAFANQGYRLTPQTISRIETFEGEVIYKADPSPKVRAIDERVAWLISDILSDNDARVIGFGVNSALKLDRPAAVKTGTTTNFHDNWTIGYTPDLVVGVWVGNTNHEPMRDVSGLTGAAPIWHQFMRTVLTGKPELSFERPAGMGQVEVCALSGLLPTPDCPYTRMEWFIAGTEPLLHDDIYKTVVIDASLGQLANENTPPERRKTITVLDLPSQAYVWAKSEGILLLSDYVSPGGAGSNSVTDSGLRVLSPGSGAVYQLTGSMSAESQKLHIEAVGPLGVQSVTLWLDGQSLVHFDHPPFEFWWPLQGGDHTLWVEAVDSSGEQLSSPTVHFSVKAAEH